jgi:AraC-like DNA-binding protein
VTEQWKVRRYGCDTLSMVLARRSFQVARRLHGRRTHQVTGSPGCHILVARPGAVLEVTGDTPERLIDANRLCCLLAVFDSAMGVRAGPGTGDERVRLATLPARAFREPAMIETAILTGWLDRSACRSLLVELRRREAYTLVRYLLNSRSEGRTLLQLCVLYGLSYSHFRRLCNRILGGSVKDRMDAWRAARSALALVEQDRPVWTIAAEQGYASASHISHDMKRRFGLTPRALIRAGRDLGEGAVTTREERGAANGCRVPYAAR